MDFINKELNLVNLVRFDCTYLLFENRYIVDKTRQTMTQFRHSNYLRRCLSDVIGCTELPWFTTDLCHATVMRR